MPRPLLAVAIGIAAAVVLGACASGDVIPRDAGATTDDRGGRDSDVGVRDTGSTFRDTGTADTGGRTVADDTSVDTGAVDAGPVDTGTGGTPTGPDWAPWWSNAPTANPLVAQTSEASYYAVVSYCECCNTEFGNDPGTCFETAFYGGFRVGVCEAAELDRLGSQADGWLGCMETAWSAFAACDACATSACALCANNFAYDVTACSTQHPAAAAAMGNCAE